MSAEEREVRFGVEGVWSNVSPFLVDELRYFPQQGGSLVGASFPPSELGSSKLRSWIRSGIVGNPRELIGEFAGQQSMMRYAAKAPYVVPLQKLDFSLKDDSGRSLIWSRHISYGELLYKLRDLRTQGEMPGSVCGHFVPEDPGNHGLRGLAALLLNAATDSHFVLGPSQRGKTLLLAMTIIAHFGPTIAWSSRNDLMIMTLSAAQVRAYLGGGHVYQLVTSRAERDKYRKLMKVKELPIRLRCVDLTMGCANYDHAENVSSAIASASIMSQRNEHWLKSTRAMLAPLLYLGAVTGKKHHVFREVLEMGLSGTVSSVERQHTASLVQDMLEEIITAKEQELQKESQKLNPNRTKIDILLAEKEQARLAAVDWARVYGLRSKRITKKDLETTMIEPNASREEYGSMVSTAMDIFAEVTKYSERTEGVLELTLEEFVHAVDHFSTIYAVLPSANQDKTNRILAAWPGTMRRLYSDAAKGEQPLNFVADEIGVTLRHRDLAKDVAEGAGERSKPFRMTVALQDPSQIDGAFGPGSKDKLLRSSAVVTAFGDAHKYLGSLPSNLLKYPSPLSLPDAYRIGGSGVPTPDYVLAELRFFDVTMRYLTKRFSGASMELHDDIVDAIYEHLHECRVNPDAASGLAKPTDQRYLSPVDKQNGSGWQGLRCELEAIKQDVRNRSLGRETLAIGELPEGTAVVQRPGGDAMVLPMWGVRDLGFRTMLENPDYGIDDPELSEAIKTAKRLFDPREVARVNAESWLSDGSSPGVTLERS